VTVGKTSCADAIGVSLQRAHVRLAERWLERLMALIPVDARSVFPTDLLLDHIPGLIEEIGRYVSEPADEDIAARTIVIAKARALGQLRHQQQASLHQVLREYDVLGEVLEEFLVDETRTLPPSSLGDCLEAWRRIGRAVRVLMQITAGTFITGYTQTVTEQAERLDRFNRAVGHELRNVLGTLQFAAALLGAGPVADDTQHTRLTGTVQRSADRALKIIRSFERLPRSGIVADKPTEQIVDLSELIREVFRQLQDMADARGVELRTRSDRSMAYLDTGALELILVNLVANAIKYSDHHKSTRFVDVECSYENEHYEIQVEDNGIGIPADAVAGVFERFARAHSHLDADLGVEGTGIGLAIVDECVKALGGDIRLESREQLGTTFTVRIPKKVPPISPGQGEPPVQGAG
jgi:signal transduction histidine kinase